MRWKACGIASAFALLSICAAGAVPARSRASPLEVRAGLIPLDYADGQYSALVQIIVDGSPLRNASWELTAALGEDPTRPVATVKRKIDYAEPWTTIALEKEIRFPPGRHELAVTARETHREYDGVDFLSAGGVETVWPDPDTQPASVAPIAIIQATRAAFGQGAESDLTVKAAAALERAGLGWVHRDAPVVLLSLVCAGPGVALLSVETELRGPVSPVRNRMAIDARQNRCLQIRDGILADSLPEGRYQYDVIVSEHGKEVARRSVVLSLIERPEAPDELHAQVDSLIHQAETARDEARPKEALAALEEALDATDTPHIQVLLEQARLERDIQIAAEQMAQRKRAIAKSFDRAQAFREERNWTRAQAELKRILDLDPGNRRARTIRDEIHRLVEQSRWPEDQRQQVERLVSEADELRESADHEQALVVANRALSLDPGNTRAAATIAASYRELSLRSEAGAKLRPLIDFFKLQDVSVVDFVVNGGRVVLLPEGDERADGQAELIHSPEVVLAGNVIDDTPVELAFFDGDQPIGGGTHRLRSVQELHITDFLLRHRLTSSLTFDRRVLKKFQAVATDAEGQQSTADYSVIYVVPFYRSLWTYLGLTSVLVVAALGLVGIRARRRRKRRSRRFNPYIAGAPVLDADLFFGRERLLQRVLQSVHNNSILLYGERRIGKTSFQHQLYRRLKELEDDTYTFYPVFIDLQGTPQEHFFRTLMQETLHELGPKLDGFDPRLSADAGTEYRYRDFVRDVSDVVKLLGQTTSKRVKLVLQIDEVDELNEYDPRINQRLRSLFMRNFAENLAAVVSGVAIKKDWASHGSPWYNFFEEIEVQPFRREDAVALVMQPVRGMFTVEKGVVDEILAQTDQKPYLIQKLCVALVNRLHEERRQRITLADVKAVSQPGRA